MRKFNFIKGVCMIKDFIIIICIWTCITLAMMSVNVETNTLGYICYTVGAVFIGAGGTWYVGRGYDELLGYFSRSLKYEKSRRNGARKKTQ